MDDTAETRQTATAFAESLDQRDWPGLTALLAEDVVYEMPQTRERIRAGPRSCGSTWSRLR